MKPIIYTIDASGRTLGHVASEASQALLGKKSVHFMKNQILPITVVVENASKLSIPPKRLADKVYVHYTGYPGGLRKTTLPMRLDKKGVEFVLRKTIQGMMHRTKLRNPRMKKLIIKL